MKITFDDVVNGREWIHAEMRNSLTHDLIDKAVSEQCYEVKILINGVEVEPELYNKIMNGVEKYIEIQAKELVIEKLEEADNKSRKLNDLINEACEKIKEEFKLDN